MYLIKGRQLGCIDYGIPGHIWTQSPPESQHAFLPALFIFNASLICGRLHGHSDYARYNTVLVEGILHVSAIAVTQSSSAELEDKEFHCCR